MIHFNPLDFPVLFQEPERLTQHSFWYEHIPFGMLLVSILEPKVIAELGTHYGESYCAFCQSVKYNNLKSRCYSIDTWQGDIHYGEYGPEVLKNLKAYHDPKYSHFSTLIQSTFEDALNRFHDKSIDLLHIDGTHTYESVANDFFKWLPKMSDRGVVLMHDTNVVKENYGVKRLFSEIKSRYRHFEFYHGYGLGVLFVGSECPEAIMWLFDLDEKESQVLRSMFYALGRAYSLKGQICEYENMNQRLLARIMKYCVKLLK